MESASPDAPKRRYLWPWLVWGAFILGCILAGLWLRAEINRIRQQQQIEPTNALPSPTGSMPQHPAAGRSQRNNTQF